MPGVHTMTYHRVLEDFFATGRTLTYKRGEILQHAGDPPQGVYMITKGYVKVYSITKRGNENVHVIYQKGEVFPLIWALKNLPRNVYYEALTEVTVQRCSRDAFLDFINNTKDAAMALITRIVEQFYIYTERLDNLEYQNASERIIYRLLFMTARLGEKSGKDWKIAAPLTHQDIASTINLARETVSREFEKLENKGLLYIKDRHIYLTDVHALNKLLGEDLDLTLWGLN